MKAIGESAPVSVLSTGKPVMPLSIFERDGKIAVRSPYHPQFPARARQLGGTWDTGRLIWLFDARDEERVRELCAWWRWYGRAGAGVPDQRRRASPAFSPGRALGCAGPIRAWPSSGPDRDA